jgi:hypothetical protein
MEATIGFDLRSIVSDPSWTVDRRTRDQLPFPGTEPGQFGRLGGLRDRGGEELGVLDGRSKAHRRAAVLGRSCPCLAERLAGLAELRVAAARLRGRISELVLQGQAPGMQPIR